MPFLYFHKGFKIVRQKQVKITLRKKRMSQFLIKRSNSTQMKYRKWNNVIQPLLRFQRASSQLSYSLDLMNQLQKILTKNTQLKLNIPFTLSGVHDNCLKTVYNNNEEIGTIVFTPAVLKVNYDQDVEKEVNWRMEALCERETTFNSFIKEKHENNSINQTVPFVVIKQKTQTNNLLSQVQLKSSILSKDQYKKLPNLESNQVIQSFIFGNTSTPSITRFFYFPKKETLSIAYKMDNNENSLKKRFHKSSWRVEMDNQYSFTFVKILHQNKSFTQQTMNLVRILESSTKSTIQKIVCDWVIDSFNRYVLLDVKQIKFGVAETIPVIHKDLRSMLSVITCGVCQQRFPNTEISKIITYKMIGEFFQHLRKRKISLSFKPNSKCSSSSSSCARVCDICYMLVVSESKLIQLQKTMAKATMSIDVQQNEQTKIVLQQLISLQPCQYKQKQLRQLYSWRLFFYIEDIRQLSQLGEQFTPQKQYFLMIKLHNQVTSIKLKDLSDKSKQNLPIKAMKITYLFSQEQKIDKFINKSEIKIRITSQNNWNSVIAQGSSNSLYHESEKFSMRKYKQILLFNSNSKYCVLGLHIGIKLDGVYSTEKLTLNKIQDVYLPNQKYTNCLPIPPEWMEIIDPTYQLNQDRNTKFQYQLNMNSKEIKKLLPSINKIAGKKKLVL